MALAEAGVKIENPAIPLQPGENYRFHFDATKCVGCKCCEVACHEQNNNPPEVKWRQVGEIEGGEFPETKRFYISMACNHCQDPACLNGCPVDAYYKDEKTGIVRMKDDACIGCQYCTWNCPYGAPQFNPERNMVTKCDMCSSRIEGGQNPACVEACPSEALKIERYLVADWNKESANAPGVPDAGITGSTTRITPPKKNGFDLKRIDVYRIRPEHPHYSLILLTVLTQLAVGGFSCLFFLEAMDSFFGFSGKGFFKVAHLVMFGTAALALNTAFFHLGRPIFAMRALKMWRRSWLSREVLFFTLFVGMAALYCAVLWQEFWKIPEFFRWIVGGVTSIFGFSGVYSSAMIYRVPARPSWDTVRTPVAFFATSFILGAISNLVIFSWIGLDEKFRLMATVLMGCFLLAGFTQIAAIFVKILYSFQNEEPELKASAQMLTQRFRVLFLSRMGLLLGILLGIPMILFSMGSQASVLAPWLSVLGVLGLFSELMGRYLFFVTVVPKKRPEGYF